MIKLIDLLNEVVPPKNTWFPLYPEEVRKLRKDVYNMLEYIQASIDEEAMK